MEIIINNNKCYWYWYHTQSLAQTISFSPYHLPTMMKDFQSTYRKAPATKTLSLDFSPSLLLGMGYDHIKALSVANTECQLDLARFSIFIARESNR